MMAAITTFEHPSLGPICGKAGDGLTQFLGLKYASLRDRLAEPEMITEAHEKAINATKIGSGQKRGATSGNRLLICPQTTGTLSTKCL